MGSGMALVFWKGGLEEGAELEKLESLYFCCTLSSLESQICNNVGPGEKNSIFFIVGWNFVLLKR